MEKVIIVAGLCLVALIVAGLIVFFLFPEKVVQLINWNYANKAGLKKKSIVIDDYKVHFYQSRKINKRETLVLLHGLGDDKSSFLQSAKFISKHYNLVLPDLRGHGENDRKRDGDYSIYGQAQFLRELLQKLDITSFHLGGNSMGGHTVLSYALNYPGEIKSLVLVNAPGVTLDDHIVYGGFGEPLEDKEDLDKLLERVFYQVPDLPSPIANHMMKAINDDMDFTDERLIPSITHGKDFNMKDRLQQIKAPTLIVWGKHDRVVKFNVAEYFNETIPNSTLEIIETGSHSPQLEVPEKVAVKIESFLREL